MDGYYLRINTGLPRLRSELPWLDSLQKAYCNLLCGIMEIFFGCKRRLAKFLDV